MSKENFEVISVLGPLGSGKTTTLNNLIEHVPMEDSYAVVVNDVGENNIDAQRIWDHPANRSEKIIPLTAGCIGCSDVTQFREALERVYDSGVNVLFIEPTGIAPGTEIADVVRSSGFDLSVLTLVNARTVERDLKWQVLPSQLSVADIIGVTHIPDDRDKTEVIASVLEQLPPLPDEVSVELIDAASTNYFEVLAKLRGMDRELRFGRQLVDICIDNHSHNHDHDHGHDHHDHDHHDGHGVSAKSFALKETITVEQVEQLLRSQVDNNKTPLLRAKGFVSGYRFDLVGDEWNVRKDDSNTPSTMNVIFGGGIPNGFLDDAYAMASSVERSEFSGDKKAIVKSISEMSIDDRASIISERVSQYPAPISMTHGELIPDCEADEGYEIAFWGNADDMDDASKATAMKAYIQFRLDGLHQLQHHADAVVNSDKKYSYWTRRYGATLGYNSYHLSEYISDEQLAEIKKVNPAKLLIDGLMQLDSLTFDEGRAEEKPEFLLQVFSSALRTGDIDMSMIKQLEQHVYPLVQGNPQFSQRWKSLFDKLSEL